MEVTVRPAAEIRYLVLAAQREGNRQLAEALKPLGLTPSQAEVVRLVADYQPLTMKELGRLLVCESGTNPSRLVDRLVTSGLIERNVDVSDRRAVKLTLTEKGSSAAVYIAEIEEAMYAMIDERTKRSSEEFISSLRMLVADTPAGDAIERRKQAK
jgi:MarR family transcriptional regulator, organic hydroperoxide resistance regulator